MSNPAKYDFTMVKGDTFSDVWTVRDADGVVVDLSAGSAKYEINEKNDGSGDVYLTATTGGGGIALGSDGTITFSIASGTTAALTFTKGYYDFELTLSGVVETIMFGQVTLQPKIA